MAAGLLRPASGTVRIDGREPWGSTSREFRARTGFLPQDLAFPGFMRVRDYLRYVAWLKGLDRRTAEAAADRALDGVDLADRGGDRLRSLSGGMLRRVGRAQAVVHGPTVVLLDEPTTGLDPQQRLSVRADIRGAGAASAVLLSTHLTDDVAAVADRVAVLLDGDLIQDVEITDFCHPEPVTAEAVESAYLRLVGARG